MADEEAKSGSRTGPREDDDGSDDSRPADDGGNDSREADHGSDESRDDSGGERDEQQVSAPSLGPKTVIEREPVEERLARHEQSEVDAMGKDKRRPVVGESHGPSLARQLLLYGVFLAVVAALAVGGFILVGSLDKSVGKDIPHSAPWSKPGAKQIKPKPIQ